MKPEKSEPARVYPQDEIRIGRSSWNDDDVSIKYTWFDKGGQPSRAGEVPIAAFVAADVRVCHSRGLSDHRSRLNPGAAVDRSLALK